MNAKTRPCDFLGCTNPVPTDLEPWAMCDPCYFEATEDEDFGYG